MTWIKSSKCEQGACVEVDMNWIKSSKCDGGACVEVTTNWTKSTKCDNGSCVEVRSDQEMIAVRNTQVPGEVVWFSRDEWTAFIAGVKEGEFDL